MNSKQKRDQICQCLQKLINQKSDIIIYGGKYSGKTTLIQRLLKKKTKYYMTIRSCLAFTKWTFMQMMILQISAFIQKNILILTQKQKKIKSELQKQLKILQQKEGYINTWSQKMKVFLTNHQQLFYTFPQTYLFIDGIQSLPLQIEFLPDIYKIIKNQLKLLKISVIFCGVSSDPPVISQISPLDQIPIVKMPNIDPKKIIRQVIIQSPLYIQKHYLSLMPKDYIQKLNQQQQQRLWANFFKSIQQIIYDLVEDEFNIVTIGNVTGILLQYIYHRQFSNPNYLQMELLNMSDIKKQLITIQKCLLQGSRWQSIIYKNNQCLPQKQQNQKDRQYNQFLQRYPNLLLGSVWIANKIPENQDIKLQQANNMQNKQENKKIKSNNQIILKLLKKEPQNNFTPPKHYTQRILSICDMLIQQSKKAQYNIEVQQQHSLDALGCIQYLKQQGYVNYDFEDTKFGGKISGLPNHEKSVNLMRQLDLDFFDE